LRFFSANQNLFLGIFGLIDPTEIPGYVEDGRKEPKVGGEEDKKKEKKKKKTKKKKHGVKTVVKYNMAGVF
jgi:hypothetical protein